MSCRIQSFRVASPLFSDEFMSHGYVHLHRYEILGCRCFLSLLNPWGPWFYPHGCSQGPSKKRKHLDGSRSMGPEKFFRKPQPIHLRLNRVVFFPGFSNQNVVPSSIQQPKWGHSIQSNYGDTSLRILD